MKGKIIKKTTYFNRKCINERTRSTYTTTLIRKKPETIIYFILAKQQDNNKMH